MLLDTTQSVTPPRLPVPGRYQCTDGGGAFTWYGPSFSQVPRYSIESSSFTFRAIFLPCLFSCGIVLPPTRTFPLNPGHQFRVLTRSDELDRPAGQGRLAAWSVFDLCPAPMVSSSAKHPWRDASDVVDISSHGDITLAGARLLDPWLDSLRRSWRGDVISQFSLFILCGAR